MTSMHIGEGIQKARLDAKLSQTQLAARVGVSRAMISQWENKNQVPSGPQRSKLHAQLPTLKDYCPPFTFGPLKPKAPDFDQTLRLLKSFDAVLQQAKDMGLSTEMTLTMFDKYARQKV